MMMIKLLLIFDDVLFGPATKIKLKIKRLFLASKMNTFPRAHLIIKC